MKRVVFIAFAVLLTFILSAIIHETLPIDSSPVSVLLGFGACIAYNYLVNREIINDK